MYVRMAERSKALRSGRSLILQAWVRIPLLTHFCSWAEACHKIFVTDMSQNLVTDMSQNLVTDMSQNLSDRLSDNPGNF